MHYYTMPFVIHTVTLGSRLRVVLLQSNQPRPWSNADGSTMARIIVLILLQYAHAARRICTRESMPLEVGSWSNNLVHMDSAIVENAPVSLNEGQVYVYENYFPNKTIRYIHVDNLARRTCGANASIKSGGIGQPTVLVVLHSDPFQEIRSVIEIWGTNEVKKQLGHFPVKVDSEEMKKMKSLYLFKDMRAYGRNMP